MSAPKINQPSLAAGDRRRQILLGVIIICIVAVLWVVYEFGQIRAGHNSFQAREEVGELARQLEKYAGQNDELRRQIALLETSRKIDEEAYRQVEQKLSGLQDQILTQREELAFYRGILADQETGLRIQGLELLDGESRLTFNLRLVLAQAMRATKRISGSIDLRVEGERDGEPVVLTLADLGIEGEQRKALTTFSFRYFQNLEADLVLPEGFSPARLVVTLKPNGSKAEPEEKAFDWALRTGSRGVADALL